MRFISVLFAIVFAAGLVLAECPCLAAKGGTVTIMDDLNASPGNSQGNGQGGNGGQGVSASNESPKMLPAWDDSKGASGGRENLTQEQVRNRTKEQDKNGTQSQVHVQADNETGNGKTVNWSGNGISTQVHVISELRRNGTLTVPQGMIVRIVAHDHTINAGNITALALNETLMANLSFGWRNKTLRIAPVPGGVNISDNGAGATTDEMLEIENGSLSVGGSPVNVPPSDVPGKLNAHRIRAMEIVREQNRAMYRVNATKKAKFLWLFDVDMDVDADVDAGNGQVMRETRPWWSFLAGEAS